MAPARTLLEHRTSACFEALMQSLSFPGSLQKLPANSNLLTIALTLVDQEVTVYTPDAALFAQLRETGGRVTSLQQADFVFLPEGQSVPLEDLKRGHLLYPDQSATLVVWTRFEGPEVVFRGPGVNGERTLQVEMPETFWQQRTRQTRYPLGWDVFFTDGVQVMGLPRSVRAEVV